MNLKSGEITDSISKDDVYFIDKHTLEKISPLNIVDTVKSSNCKILALSLTKDKSSKIFVGIEINDKLTAEKLVDIVETINSDKNLKIDHKFLSHSAELYSLGPITKMLHDKAISSSTLDKMQSIQTADFFLDQNSKVEEEFESSLSDSEDCSSVEKDDEYKDRRMEEFIGQLPSDVEITEKKFHQCMIFPRVICVSLQNKNFLINNYIDNNSVETEMLKLKNRDIKRFTNDKKKKLNFKNSKYSKSSYKNRK